MMWEPSGCCCFKLRTGSIIIAILFLIGGCFTVIEKTYTLIKEDTDIEDFCEDESGRKECEALLWNVELWTACTSLGFALFHIVFSSLLLYGIYKKKTAFFIPLMIVYTVKIGLEILVTAFGIGVSLYLALPGVFLLIFAVIFGLVIFLDTYFLLVIRAHYYEIKRAKAHIHIALREESADAP